MPSLSAMETKNHYQHLKVESIEECVFACHSQSCKFYYVSSYTKNCYLYDKIIPTKCSTSDVDDAIDFLIPAECTYKSG